MQHENDKAIRMIEVLQRENKILSEECDTAKDTLINEKGKLLREIDNCNNLSIE